MQTKKSKSGKAPLTIRKLKKKAWAQFSKYIRHKYADKNGNVKCYTCGKIIPAIGTKEIKGAEAGHGLAGRGNAILFDEELVKPQCYICNVIKGGNYDVFHAKLIKENGFKWFQEKLKLKNKTKQFTREELEELYNKYKNE